MVQRSEYEWAQSDALKYLERAGIVLTPEEAHRIEVADFGLGELRSTGMEVVTYVNTERVCAKELILFPRQTCPEHYHPPLGSRPGKEETFRCRWGEAFLYVSGDPTPNPKGIPPRGREHAYTIWHEIVLKPGEQYTLAPGTLHWFQSGDQGAIVSEFSTTSYDDSDVWTDKEIKRLPTVEE